jgi:sulfur-carrier protein
MPESTEFAPVRVTLTGAFRPYTEGGETFELQVRTIRGLLRALDERYPGLGEVLEQDTAIAIDGVIHEVVYTHRLRPGAEVYFIPRLESG